MNIFKFIKRTLCLSIVLAFTLALFSTDTALAASGTAKLTSSASSVQVGNNFTVTVSANTDSAISIAQIKVIYNSSAIKYQSISYSGSPLTTDTPDSSITTGSIKISRYVVGNYPSGNITIAKINFTALASSGDGGLSINKSESALYSASNASDILTSVSGADVALQPVPAPPPSSDPSSPDKDTKSAKKSSTGSGAGSTTTGGSSGASGSGSSSGSGSTSSGSPTQGNTGPTQAFILPEPGKSQVATQVSFSKRLAKNIKTYLPKITVATVVVGVSWYAISLLKTHSIGFGSGGMASTVNATDMTIDGKKFFVGGPGAKKK
jgi:hypothetical protein